MTGSSEISSFSNPIRTKCGAYAKLRFFSTSDLQFHTYKESVSKSARGIKDKLLAHNSVKELSKGVHREMTARLAEVSRMIEHLELTPKRNDTSSPVSHYTRTSSDWEGNHVPESIVALNIGRKAEQTAPDISSDAASHSYG